VSCKLGREPLNAILGRVLLSLGLLTQSENSLPFSFGLDNLSQYLIHQQQSFTINSGRGILFHEERLFPWFVWWYLHSTGEVLLSLSITGFYSLINMPVFLYDLFTLNK
jgi:hypothetical protein